MAIKTSATPAIDMGERAEFRYSDNLHQKRAFGLNFSYRLKRGREHRQKQIKRGDENRTNRAAWSNDKRLTAADFPKLVTA